VRIVTDRFIGPDMPPPLIPRLLNKLTSPRSAPAPMLRFHRWIYGRSDGRIGPDMIGAWTLLLHTIGRRTGQRRTTALVFARDGEGIVLAASNDGKYQSPAWFLNLCANPKVELQIGRRRQAGTASVIEPSDPDYQRLWEAMNRTNNRRYDTYQSKTSRPIPLVSIMPEA
jgi:F420H(2)-dependent quinone reductase